MEIKIIILWVLLVTYIVPGLIFGYQKLIGQKQKLEQFRRFGYPVWFMRLLGLAEISACIMMLFNSTRLWGIFIFPLILAGAVSTHLKANDPKNEVMTPIFVALHLTLIFFVTIWI